MTNLSKITADDIDPQTFRNGLRQLAGAVSVITVGRGEERNGLTATSVTSFSAEPPTILVSVARTASAYQLLLRERRFVVNVLGDHQQAIADRFAGRNGEKGPARFEGAVWTVLATGAPALVDALAAIDCELDEVIERHSHGLVLGRVKALKVRADAGALLYWRGAYERFEGSPAAGDGI